MNTAKRYIILVHGRGDYITSLNDKGDIIGGSAEDAIQYTMDEAESVVEWLGSGLFTIKDAASPPDPRWVTDINIAFEAIKNGLWTVDDFAVYLQAVTDEDRYNSV